jgi:hypothetical protein
LESNDWQRIECNAGSFEVLGAIGTLPFGASCKCIHKSHLSSSNQVQVNHLTCLQQPIGDPRNEPSREPIHKPTKQMDLDDVLPDKRSQINNAVLSNRSNQPESFSDQPGIDEEIDHPIAASDSSKNQWQMPTPINLDSSGLCQSTTMTNQLSTAHLHLAR